MSVKELGMNNDSDGDVELTDVEEVDLEGELTSGSENWTCDELIPFEIPLICKVPQRVVIFMRSVERIMALQGLGSMEFGVFLKGQFLDGVLYVDENTTFIPKQKVTSVTVDFQEDPPEDNYNGVIHRHPTGCKNFSGTDAHHINRNFEFSLLYEGNDVIRGIINVAVGNVRIQLPLKIEVQYPVFNIGNSELITEKIQKDTSMMSSTSGRDYRDRDVTGLLTDGEDDSGTVPFGDRESVIDAMGEDREDDEYEMSDDASLYQCDSCGEPNIVSEWPHLCDSCDKLLSYDDAEYIIDIGELDEDAQAIALQKLADSGAEIDLDEEEVID